jgi:hypothetical protein
MSGIKTPITQFTDTSNISDTGGSHYLSDFLAHRTVPQQIVYRSKKYRTIQKEFMLKTQFSVYRSLPKLHFFLSLTLKCQKSVNHTVT